VGRRGRCHSISRASRPGRRRVRRRPSAAELAEAARWCLSELAEAARWCLSERREIDLQHQTEKSSAAEKKTVRRRHPTRRSRLPRAGYRLPS